MIDKSIPHYPLTMYKPDYAAFPRYSLPDGYSFVFYKSGDEAHWADIEVSVGQFSSAASATESFMREFVNGHELDPAQRMLFVTAPSGEYVATATLWDGNFLGRRLQRIHWVAVKDKCAGQGIAKAMLCRLLELHLELGYEDTVYLLTGTRNFPAVAIYRKFGFVEYEGPASLSSKLTDEQFVLQTQKAISIINQRLSR